MTRAIDRGVCAAALIIALVAIIAALRWTSAHPYPIWWDEANYFNQVVDDRRAFLRGGALAAVKSLLFADNLRPPAYRALVAPIAAVTLPSLTLLRTIALCVTIASLALLWRACRTVASLPSSLLATALVLSMPEVLASGAWFGTEYPLFLAVALLLFSLLRNVPFGITAAVALGLFSKSTFFVIGGPALLAALITARDRDQARRLLVASACGVLIAAGWWCWDPVSPIRFAQDSRTFARAVFDDPLSLAAFAEKLRRFVAALGVGVVTATGMLSIDAVRKRDALSPDVRRAVFVAAATVVPLILLAMLSPTFGARIFAPALLALALPLAILLERARPAVRVGVAAIALIQVASIAATPMRFLPRVEQTDWAQLRTLVQAPAPRIAFIGGWPSMSPPEIRYGWTRDGSDASTVWLWRSEERQIDWPKVMREALGSDAVLVVPPAAAARTSDSDSRSRRYELADNRHNAELIRRLQASGKFEAAVPFRVGMRESVDLLVYLRKSRSADHGREDDSDGLPEGVAARDASRRR